MVFGATLGAHILGVLIALVIFAWLIGVPLACALKGKWWFMLFALLGGWLGLVGAIRLAKPDSYWARHWYGDEKMATTEQRFAPDPALSEPAPHHPEDSEQSDDDDVALQDKLTRLSRSP